MEDMMKRRLKQVELPSETMKAALEMQDEVAKMVTSVGQSENPRNEMAGLMARLRYLVRR